MKYLISFFLLFSFFSFFSLKASDRLCRILDYACDSSSGNSGATKSYPAASDSAGTNPAAIPTGATPFGLEGLYGDGTFLTGVFKGFGTFGMAGGTMSKKNSFFSNASNIASSGVNFNRDVGEDINEKNYLFATAIPLFQKQLRRLLYPSIGVGARYYRGSEKWRETYGLTLSNYFMHFGAAVAKNEMNGAVISQMAGLSLGNISLDFTYIRNLRGIKNRTRIYSLAWSISQRWSIVGAHRDQQVELTPSEIIYLRNTNKRISEKHLFLGVQYQLMRPLSLAGYSNYVVEGPFHYGIRLTLGFL